MVEVNKRSLSRRERRQETDLFQTFKGIYDSIEKSGGLETLGDGARILKECVEDMDSSELNSVEYLEAKSEAYRIFMRGPHEGYSISESARAVHPYGHFTRQIRHAIFFDDHVQAIEKLLVMKKDILEGRA